MAICGKSKIRGLVMAPALFALVAGISPMAQAQDERSGLSDTQRGLASPIEGSWLFAIENSGNSLISFAAGGVVVTTGSLPPPPILYGSWKQRESNRFNAAFYGFLPDSAGRGVALLKISLEMHLTGRNELAGTAVVYTCDLQAENCINPVDLQFTGKRLAPE